MIYGTAIPITANSFFIDNIWTALGIMLSCYVLSIILWSGRALLLNIVLAIYVFKVYLTLPYIDLFLNELNTEQYTYIKNLHGYYNTHDANIVYFSLLSMLIAWACGLAIQRKQPMPKVPVPWIFQQVDQTVMQAHWPFWLVWATSSALSYQSATTSWQGIANEGEGVGLFAYGLFSMETISYVCLFSFISSLRANKRRSSPLLLIPIATSIIQGSMAGSRGALFAALVYALIYWSFINFNTVVKVFSFSRTILTIFILPLMVYAGLLAQSLRPLLRSGAPAESIWEATILGLDILDFNNPVFQTFYYGITELLHRLSSLGPQFLILNDHYMYDPSAYYNPLQTLMRIANDLLPGDPFNAISINQLFSFVYSGTYVTYSSENWSIQGTLYLFFGHWISLPIIFSLAWFLGGLFRTLEGIAQESPAFSAFFIMMFLSLLEFGTLERTIPVDIVRPIASYLAVAILAGSLQSKLFERSVKIRPAPRP